MTLKDLALKLLKSGDVIICVKLYIIYCFAGSDFDGGYGNRVGGGMNMGGGGNPNYTAF